jgi:hypothetical protein
MPRSGFEPAIPPTKRPQTYALDRAATGIGYKHLIATLNLVIRDSHNVRSPSNHGQCGVVLEQVGTLASRYESLPFQSSFKFTVWLVNSESPFNKTTPSEHRVGPCDMRSSYSELDLSIRISELIRD